MVKKLGIVPILIIIALGAGIVFYFSKGNLQSPATQIPSSWKVAPVHEIVLDKNGFSPVSITIKKGEAVTWINQSGRDASVNSAPHPTHNLYRFLNLGVFPNGSSVQTTFENAGSYSYHNHLKSEQQGTVVVK